MRPLLLIFLAGTLLAPAQNTTTTTLTPAQQADQYYAQGIAAEKAGDPNAAREAYLSALKLNPRHAYAQHRVALLKSSGPAIAQKGRQAKFGQMTITQYAIEDATLSEALETLRVHMEKADPQQSPNFMIKDPENKLGKARISFQLKGVPAKAILDYIVSHASAKVTYEECAVVISPAN